MPSECSCRSPAFTAIAVLTLALGIGANTALFSVVNGVLLNPLAYPHSNQLVAIYEKIAGLDSAPIEYMNFLDWQRDSRTFASMAAYRNEDYNFIGNGEGERLSGYMVSGGFFNTLGVAPVLGRDVSHGRRSTRRRAGRRTERWLLEAQIRLLARHNWQADHPEWNRVHHRRRHPRQLQLLRQLA